MPDEGPQDPVAKAVRAARHYSGKSRAQLGKDLGVSAGTVGRYERGEWKGEGPRKAILEGIARATQVHLMLEVFGGAETGPSPGLNPDELRAMLERLQDGHAQATDRVQREKPTGPDDAGRARRGGEGTSA